jgi:hypothetical protein
MVAQAFPKVMTIDNITAGFRTTGIFPFNPNIHKATDFVPSLVTDRPDPNVSSAVKDVIPSTGTSQIPMIELSAAGPTAAECNCQPSVEQEIVTVRISCFH